MNKSRCNIFWGSIFVLAATFIIASRLGVFGYINLVTIILSIGLGAIIIRSIPSVNFAGILIPIAFLCVLYDEQWGITELTPWPVLLTAVLGSIGLSLIFKKKKKYYWKKNDYYQKGSHKKNEEIIDSPDGNCIEVSCRFGASSKYINSDDFQKAELRCEFGALKAYFDNAIIQGEYAQLHVYASFSGVEIYIPKNWVVENYSDSTFGALDEHRHPQINEYSKTLKIYGNINFSGVEIFYL